MRAATGKELKDILTNDFGSVSIFDVAATGKELKELSKGVWLISDKIQAATGKELKGVHRFLRRARDVLAVQQLGKN